MYRLYSRSRTTIRKHRMIAARHTHMPRSARRRVDASGGLSITDARNARRRIVVIDSSGFPNRGLLASAKTQVRRVIAVLSAAAGALLLILTPVSAQVARRVVGPSDPRTGFPVGLIDERGTSLAPCVDDILLCPSTLPDLGLPPDVPGNFPDEFFYSLASADLNAPGSSVATLLVAVDRSFVNAPLVE